MDRFLKQNRKASLDVIVCYWKPSSNKRFSGNTEYFRAEYFLEEYFLAEYFSAGYFLVNYFSEEYLMAVCFIRDAKSGRSGRYICAIFFQLVLIFGLCTQKNVLLPVLLAPVSNDFVRTISISNSANTVLWAFFSTTSASSISGMSASTSALQC